MNAASRPEAARVDHGREAYSLDRTPLAVASHDLARDTERVLRHPKRARRREALGALLEAVLGAEGRITRGAAMEATRGVMGTRRFNRALIDGGCLGWWTCPIEPDGIQRITLTPEFRARFGTRSPLAPRERAR